MNEPKLLKEWTNYEEMENNIVRQFTKWRLLNLDLHTQTKDHRTRDIFGLPYTSTSGFAALWNCQAKAVYHWKPEWKFLALAYSEAMEMIVVLENANEDFMYIVIG